MRIFLSWSGTHSRQTAEALHWWLPHLNDSFEPWMSAEDIVAGEIWHQSVQESLAESQFGIVCVTSQSRESPWLLFEAGALARGHNRSKIVPYLVGVDAGSLVGSPLSYFQSKSADRQGSYELVEALNNELPEAQQRPSDRLRTVFENMWPALAKKIATHAENVDRQHVIPIRDLLTSTFDQLQSLNRRQGELTLRVSDAQSLTLDVVHRLAAAVEHSTDEVRRLRQALVRKRAQAGDPALPATVPPPPTSSVSHVFCQQCGRSIRAGESCPKCGIRANGSPTPRVRTLTYGDIKPSGSQAPVSDHGAKAQEPTKRSQRPVVVPSIPPGHFVVVLDSQETELSLDEMKAHLVAGTVGADTLVRQGGMASFVELEKLPELRELQASLSTRAQVDASATSRNTILGGD